MDNGAAVDPRPLRRELHDAKRRIAQLRRPSSAVAGAVDRLAAETELAELTERAAALEATLERSRLASLQRARAPSGTSWLQRALACLVVLRHACRDEFAVCRWLCPLEEDGAAAAAAAAAKPPPPSPSSPETERPSLMDVGSQRGIAMYTR